MIAPQPQGAGAVRFERCDPGQAPASELLAAIRAELNAVYETFSRLDNPPLAPAELRPPHGAYYVGYEGVEAVAGGGLRRLGDGVAEIKRMYVRPGARSRGLATALLQTLEDAARSLGYTAVASRHRAPAGARASHVPSGRVRRGAALQHQPLRLFLGRKAAGVTAADPDLLGQSASGRAWSAAQASRAAAGDGPRRRRGCRTARRCAPSRRRAPSGRWPGTRPPGWRCWRRPPSACDGPTRRRTRARPTRSHR